MLDPDLAMHPTRWPAPPSRAPLLPSSRKQWEVLLKCGKESSLSFWYDVCESWHSIVYTMVEASAPAGTITRLADSWLAAARQLDSSPTEPRKLHLMNAQSWIRTRWCGYVSTSGACPLLRAVQHRAGAAVEELLLAGANPLVPRRCSAPGDSGVGATTALHEAVASGMTSAVRRMVAGEDFRRALAASKERGGGGSGSSNGASQHASHADSVTWYNGMGESPLHVAVRMKALNAAQALLGAAGLNTALAPGVSPGEARVAYSHLGPQVGVGWSFCMRVCLRCADVGMQFVWGVPSCMLHACALPGAAGLNVGLVPGEVRAACSLLGPQVGGVAFA